MNFGNLSSWCYNKRQGRDKVGNLGQFEDKTVVGVKFAHKNRISGVQ